MNEERIYYTCNFLKSLKSAYVVLIYESNENFHYLKRFILFERKDGFFDYQGKQFSIPKNENFFTAKEDVIAEFGTNPAELIIWEKEFYSLNKEEKVIKNVIVNLRKTNENSFLFQLRDKTEKPLDWLMKHLDSNELTIKIHMLKSFQIDESNIE